MKKSVKKNVGHVKPKKSDKVSKSAPAKGKSKSAKVRGNKVHKTMKWWARISFLIAIVYLLISTYNIVMLAGGFTDPYFYVLYLVLFVVLVLPLLFDGWLSVRKKVFKWWGRVASVFFTLMMVYLLFFSENSKNDWIPVLIVLAVYVPVYYFSWRFLKK